MLRNKIGSLCGIKTDEFDFSGPIFVFNVSLDLKLHAAQATLGHFVNLSEH